MTDTLAPTLNFSEIVPERRIVTTIPGPRSKALQERRLAVIPVGVAPSIPTCTITVVPAAGSSKLTVMIDDGKPLALPADVKLAGGRHTVVVKSGSVTKKSSELVICNRTKTLSVEGPR